MHHNLRLALATATAAALTGGLLTFTTAPATAADSTRVDRADFNGDGRGDVALAAMGAHVSGKAGAGQLVVLYGTASGVSSAKRHALSPTGVPGSAETGDHFGFDTAYADFNGDGDRWGKNLAAGDFDGDGKADLAVGSTEATVHVFKGGFTTAGTSGGRYTVKPPIMGTDAYGPLNLTAGDVNGDGRTDLVVDGYETETPYGWNRNYYVPGSANGLSTSGLQELKPGAITAIGDIDQDGYGDIVSGANWNATTEDGTPVPDAAKGGKVWVTYGAADGPAGVTGFTQDTGNVPGTSENNDFFGYELDLGDINGDGFLDLAIGVAGENIGSAANTGSITVLYGTANGLDTSSGAQSFSQDTAGVPGSNEDNDYLGMDVKLDDVNGDGRADLLAGSDENAGDGAVLYLPSSGTKITTSGARTISPGTSGVSTAGTPQFGVNFAD